MIPKRAVFRRTNSVKSGPRSKGGGTRNNGWNCGVIVIYGPAAASLLALVEATRGIWS
jgi:hypothetical protein